MMNMFMQEEANVSADEDENFMIFVAFERLQSKESVGPIMEVQSVGERN
jgi:hypothetical protein